MIRAEHLLLVRGGRPVLDLDALVLHTGRMMAVVGPNGAGKSTLCMALAGDLAPERGTVSVSGRDPGTMTHGQRARSMAILTQEESSGPFPVHEVLAMGAYASILTKAQRHALAGETLRAHGLAALADRPLDRLSGGQSRRVHLARVLLQAEAAYRSGVVAPWILADEPTDALDPRHAQWAMDALRREADRGRGVLVILHDLNLALRWADDALLLHAGRMLAHGPAARVLEPRMLERAYGVPFQRLALEGGGLAVWAGTPALPSTATPRPLRVVPPPAQILR